MITHKKAIINPNGNIKNIAKNNNHIGDNPNPIINNPLILLICFNPAIRAYPISSWFVSRAVQVRFYFFHY